MVKELIERANGWGKVIVTALLAASIPVAVGFIALGGTMRQVEVNTEQLHQHLNVYTKEADAERIVNKADIAVNKSRTDALEKGLDDLKEQNKEILRLLRKQTR